MPLLRDDILPIEISCTKCTARTKYNSSSSHSGEQGDPALRDHTSNLGVPGEVQEPEVCRCNGEKVVPLHHICSGSRDIRQGGGDVLRQQDLRQRGRSHKESAQPDDGRYEGGDGNGVSDRRDIPFRCNDLVLSTRILRELAEGVLSKRVCDREPLPDLEPRLTLTHLRQEIALNEGQVEHHEEGWKNSPGVVDLSESHVCGLERVDRRQHPMDKGVKGCDHAEAISLGKESKDDWSVHY